MLPTKGYFQDIECPFFDDTCNRPYCHFLHRRKPQETNEEVSLEAAKEPEVPTYKPTPKSELANIKSHIPISYVPDLAFRPDRTIRPIPKFSFDKPTYKPTPLSILSSVNKCENGLENDEKETNENLEAIREIKQNIANVEYNPEVSLHEDINFEDLSAEFELIDDIIQEPSKVVPRTTELEVKEDEDVGNVKISLESSREKEQEKKEKSEKRSSNSSSKSHKSKHHKKDTKEKSKDDSKTRHKEKEKESKSEKSKEKDRSSHKSRSKSSRDKEKRSREKEKERKESSSKSKDREREKRDKEKRSKDSDISNEKKYKLSDSSSDGTNDYLETNNFFDFSDVDLEDEDTLSECYKIFSEYEPPKVETPALPPTLEPAKETDGNTVISKKRIAHNSANTGESGSKIQINKSRIQVNPAQMMANRFKLAKLAQANNEQKNIINEVKQSAPKRPPSTLMEAARQYKLQKITVKEKPAESVNIIDSILNSAKNKPKKIAPVQNVNSIQRAKAKIVELAKQKAAETLKTPAQTVKGKRVAHVPDISLSDIPDVLNSDKSKLPINVRTRFLTMIADECVKLYLRKEDAYNRALNEEFGCYEKCKVLATYKNSAMLAVNRLRKELQERDKLGLGPIGEGESSEKDVSSDFKGKKFYNHIKQYILTDEELDIHGYPKESSIPGRAVIKNRRTKIDTTLGENERKCSRCSKIYLVDEDGFVLYEEECIYHPLKKRTFRGEQSYLCCKSNDDTGCATSNTHVTDFCGDSELEGFQTTMKPESESDSRSFAVYALDCEMCYTIKGLELTRVTIVDSDCKTVYESLVKPLNPIIDYNTTFSGITRDQMERTSTSILQVQANILHLCNSKTILIGHSLESDMKALKIIHGTIVDTSVLFPHKMGLPHKRALKFLASDFLKKIIQNNVSGHDSAEDAITCMELVKWKLKEELKVRGIK